MEANIQDDKMKKILFLFIGIFFGFIFSILCFIVTEAIPRDVEHYVMIVSYVLISCSAVLALIQLRQNAKKNLKEEKWNEKYLAYTKINDYIKYLEQQRTLLDKITVKKRLIKNDKGLPISFSDRRNMKIPLDFEEIHNWVCKHDKNKRKIINTSIEKKDIFITTIDGAHVVRILLSIINTYEMIASGIKNGMLDRELVLDSLSPSIVSNFTFFENYIKHRRDKHESENFACDWESLYIDIKKSNKKR